MEATVHTYTMTDADMRRDALFQAVRIAEIAGPTLTPETTVKAAETLYAFLKGETK